MIASVTVKESVEVFIQTRLAKMPSLIPPSVKHLHMITERVPDWWLANGNLLLSANPEPTVSLHAHPHIAPPVRAVVILLGHDVLHPRCTLWGEEPLIVIDEWTSMPASHIACGGGSTIAVGRANSIAGEANLNARNGGFIGIGQNGLWSNKIYASTDDMHAIIDKKTGDRVNDYGGTIIVSDHVWVGLDVMLLGGTKIGRDSVIGARSIVTHAIPEGSVAVGSPARVVRQGVTWSHEDVVPKFLSDPNQGQADEGDFRSLTGTDKSPHDG